MPKLIPCPHCQHHIRSSDAECPHCSAPIPERSGPSKLAGAALAVGLAAAACGKQVVPVYGVPETSTDTIEKDDNNLVELTGDTPEVVEEELDTVTQITGTSDTSGTSDTTGATTDSVDVRIVAAYFQHPIML